MHFIARQSILGRRKQEERISYGRKGVVNARFQVLHLKHMEYLLAAKMRCQKLYIGITNPDPSYVRESVNDENRSTRGANPLTYLERYEMIRLAMEEFGVPASEYEIMPFPINRPEYITQYVPEDGVYYLGICDGWEEEKLKILNSLGLKTEVLWRRTKEEAGVTGTWVRSCIATGEEWEHLVPKSVYQYIVERGLEERIRHLHLVQGEPDAKSKIAEEDID